MDIVFILIFAPLPLPPEKVFNGLCGKLNRQKEYLSELIWYEEVNCTDKM